MFAPVARVNHITSLLSQNRHHTKRVLKEPRISGAFSLLVTSSIDCNSWASYMALNMCYLDLPHRFKGPESLLTTHPAPPVSGAYDVRTVPLSSCDASKKREGGLT
ncbi:hypothetical protein FRB95_000188 [Tulasnella sp. JGI-2019a]|nr:hypothetical protein FRB95_000188 [Tulasnella sp. JGI-2019a]